MRHDGAPASRPGSGPRHRCSPARAPLPVAPPAASAPRPGSGPSPRRDDADAGAPRGPVRAVRGPSRAARTALQQRRSHSTAAVTPGRRILGRHRHGFPELWRGRSPSRGSRGPAGRRERRRAPALNARSGSPPVPVALRRAPVPGSVRLRLPASVLRRLAGLSSQAWPQVKIDISREVYKCALLAEIVLLRTMI